MATNMRITDHAVLRYLERVQGFNIEAVRDRIAKICEPAAKAGAGCVIKDGFRYEIDREGSVVTIAPAGQRLSWKKISSGGR